LPSKEKKKQGRRRRRRRGKRRRAGERWEEVELVSHSLSSLLPLQRHMYFSSLGVLATLLVDKTVLAN